MWKGKNKAITFSFDDGVEQDVRAIAIMEKYGLRGTFNLNFWNMGKSVPWIIGDRCIERNLMLPDRIKAVYQNQEVASHTMHHHNLTTLADKR